MHGENLGNNNSMRAQMRAGSEWKKEKRLRWTFSQSNVIVRVSEESVLLGRTLANLNNYSKNGAQMKLKKLSYVSHRIAVINTAYLEANLSLAGKNWPTNNNQATLFPLETSNDTKRNSSKQTM